MIYSKVVYRTSVHKVPGVRHLPHFFDVIIEGKVVFKNTPEPPDYCKVWVEDIDTPRIPGVKKVDKRVDILFADPDAIKAVSEGLTPGDTVTIVGIINSDCSVNSPFNPTREGKELYKVDEHGEEERLWIEDNLRVPILPHREKCCYTTPHFPEARTKSLDEIIGCHMRVNEELRRKIENPRNNGDQQFVTDYERTLEGQMRASFRDKYGDIIPQFRSFLTRTSSGIYIRNEDSPGHPFDFYIPSYCLAIEVDGPSHDRKSDSELDARHREYGIQTCRVRNEEVSNPAVLKRIVRALEEQKRILPSILPLWLNNAC